MRRIFIAGATLLGALVAALALYHYGTEFVTEGLNLNPIAATDPAPAETGSTDADEFKFSFLDQPRALPEFQFANAEGHTLSLGDFRGRPILLNIWATWCIPCRKEMPTLDRLQAAIGKSELLVLPLSIDQKGVPVVKQFYKEVGIKALGIYVDQSGKVSRSLNTFGVPTTLMIDRDGREIGRKIGAAEWDSPEMVALIREHLGLPSSAQKASP